MTSSMRSVVMTVSESTVARTADGGVINWSSTSGHTLVTGQTGSGKSVTAYLLLATAAMNSAVQVVGVDPSGVLGAPWSAVHSADWVCSADPERVIPLLEAVVDEMDRRTRALGRSGLDSIPDDWLGPRRGLYAIRVVLEEYAGLLAAVDRKTGQEITRLVGRLLREGRKARINVLTILQRPEAAVLHDRGQYQDLFLHLLESRVSVEMVLDGASDDDVHLLTTSAPGRGGYKRIGPGPVAYFAVPYQEFSDYAARVAYFAGQTPPFMQKKETG